MVRNRFNIINEETEQIICKSKNGGRHYRQSKTMIDPALVPVSTTLGRAQKEAAFLNAEYYEGWEVVPDFDNCAVGGGHKMSEFKTYDLNSVDSGPFKLGEAVYYCNCYGIGSGDKYRYGTVDIGFITDVSAIPARQSYLYTISTVSPFDKHKVVSRCLGPGMIFEYSEIGRKEASTKVQELCEEVCKD